MRILLLVYDHRDNNFCYVIKNLNILTKKGNNVSFDNLVK